MEEWKDIEGYEGHYRISSQGRIENTVTRRIRRGNCNKSGYEQVALLGKDGKYSNYLIHRLVAKAFIENPENKTTVDHIKCKEVRNNSVENLRWFTSKEQASNRLYKRDR